MTDKLFCDKCGYRIWRHADNRPYVDFYFQDRHFNCKFALGGRPPIVNGEVDPSYTEMQAASKGYTIVEMIISMMIIIFISCWVGLVIHWGPLLFRIVDRFLVRAAG